jgi:hypothetical protein
VYKSGVKVPRQAHKLSAASKTAQFGEKNAPMNEFLCLALMISKTGLRIWSTKFCQSSNQGVEWPNEQNSKSGLWPRAKICKIRHF